MAHHPALAGRPRFDIADVVRRHRDQLEADHNLTSAQRQVLSAIELCRTAALGGHIEVCRSCGYEHHHYHSCRNRHCPKCQNLAQERWIGARSEKLLPVRHFHVVFTVPQQLRSLSKYRPCELFKALFHAASATLLEFGVRHLDAQLGVTMVLHTWTRELHFHPHVHAIVTAGGLSLDGSSWISSSDNYLFNIEAMGKLIRGKMLHHLRVLQRKGVFDGFDDFDDPEGFDRLMSKLARINWLVYAKKPFREVGHVLAYLGRYTHRVAISNSRLVHVNEQRVTFRTKNANKTTITPVEFLRRFVQHVLPNGFHKIRHYGLYAGSSARTGGRLEQARNLLPVLERAASPVLAIGQLLEQLAKRLCPHCGATMQFMPLPTASSRAPPVYAAE